MRSRRPTTPSGASGWMGAVLPLVVVGDRAAVGPAAPGDPAVFGDVATVLRHAAALEEREHPRWLVTSAGSALDPLVRAGVQVQRCWDVAEVHRILHGGWRADLGPVWAALHGLDPAGAPKPAGDDLFDLLDGGAATDTDPGDPDDAVRPDGYLRPDALEPSWAQSERRFRSLASALLEIAAVQERALAELGPRALAAAYSESAAAVLCLELQRDGLPVDRPTVEHLIADAAGPRPADEADAARSRRERDARVLAHAPGREGTDLRNPTQVKDLLAAAGVSVPNTRKWVLEPFRQANPLVDALLEWRKDERIATTYGYRWLDEHVGPDGRLRGGWTACDGAAGRMTAQNGLHNLPAPLRPAVVAEHEQVFVRADLGQIEPRVLAVVSGDRAFAEATRADDLYAPVAAKLGIERKVAKVAVLAAMYGQRSGAAGRALGDLERAYPVAMRLLDDAYAAGVARQPLRTFGGRRINLDAAWAGSDDGGRGRFARNAIIQGSAAELFKAWAATVRHVTAPMGARIVLCLHDELLVQAPQERADEVADAVGRCLDDSARRWAGTDQVRFVADTSVVRRWSDAK
jgi:DNA polymerase family A